MMRDTVGGSAVQLHWDKFCFGLRELSGTGEEETGLGPNDFSYSRQMV